MHVILDGNPAGPFSTDRVRAMWKEGKVSPQTLFWREGQADWLPLETIEAEIFSDRVPRGIPSPTSTPHTDAGDTMPMSEYAPSVLPAGFWRRTGSIIIDLVILGIAGEILGTYFFDLFAQMGAWGKLVGLFVFLVYFGVQESVLTGGQTLGKRILGIRVVDRNNQCLSPERSLLRTLVWAVPYSLNGLNLSGSAAVSWGAMALGLLLITFFFAGPYLLIFNLPTRQTLHDLVTHSYVVRVEPQGVINFPQVWKAHFVIIGIWFALWVGLLVLIEATGIFTNFLSGLIAIQEKVLAVPDVQAVGVTKGTNFVMGAAASTTNLSVTVSYAHKIPDDAKAACDVAIILLADSTDTGTPDRIAIQVGRAYNIGIASGSFYNSFNLSPEEWQEKIKAEK